MSGPLSFLLTGFIVENSAHLYTHECCLIESLMLQEQMKQVAWKTCSGISRALSPTALENDCTLHVGLFLILSFIVEYVGLYIMQCFNVSTSCLFRLLSVLQGINRYLTEPFFSAILLLSACVTNDSR